MKLYAPEYAGMTVWAVAEPKSGKGAYTATKGNTPPPNASYGHPIGRYDSDGTYWTFCPQRWRGRPQLTAFQPLRQAPAWC
jgi:hypothetical protein